jgi:Mycobacterium 19 kDa lipoprotein antigen
MEKEGDDMKITKVGVAAAFGAVLASGFQVVWVPVAHADSGYKVILSGQEIGQGSDVQCSGSLSAQGALGLHINAGTRVGRVNGATAQMSGNQVTLVDMWQYDNTGSTHWQSGSQQEGSTSTYTQTGNAYTITGTAVEQGSPSSTVPFEFDATCP